MSHSSTKLSTLPESSGDGVSSLRMYSKYPGEPLIGDDHFRLLELQPGKPEDGITVRFFSVRPGDAPAYEAISYTWGDPSPEQTIAVSHVDNPSNIALEAQHVSVTPNCLAALKRVRKDITSPRTIWIDSICIDQKSIKEKNYQLQLMSQIYNGASRVVVYLGESADDSDAVMRSIQEIDTASTYNSDMRELRDCGPDSVALKEFFKRPWFKRLWVLREIEMAKEAIVYCGDMCVNWGIFRTFQRWSASQYRPQPIPYVIRISNGRHMHGGPATILLQELCDTRRCQSSDPRDRLFALLPLLWLRQRELFIEEGGDGKRFVDKYSKLKVDYNLSLAQVFVNLAEYLMEGLGPDVLRNVFGLPTTPILPSWIPDWTKEPEYSRLRRSRSMWHFTGIESTISKQDKGGSTAWTVSTILDFDGNQRHELRGEGILVGYIESFGEKCEIKSNHFPRTEWEHLLGTSAAKVARVSSDRLLVRVVSLDCGDANRSWRALEAITIYDNEVHKGPRSWYREKPSVSIYEWAETISPTYRDQVQTIMDGCDGQRLFVTENGYAGLGPENIKVGDKVFVLKDATVPFILRAHTEGEGEADTKTEIRPSQPGHNPMTLIGDCFVSNLKELNFESSEEVQKLSIK